MQNDEIPTNSHTSTKRKKDMKNIDYGKKRVKKCKTCLVEVEATRNRQLRCPNGHEFEKKTKPVEAATGMKTITQTNRDWEKSIKTLNEQHHWHIVTIKAKRHQNSVEFQYLGTPGVAKNFINDEKIGAAIKGAFEPRFKREVKEFKPSLGQKPPRDESSTTQSSTTQSSTAQSSTTQSSTTQSSTLQSSTVPLEEALEVLEEGNV
ncbi:uncharacterized protein [Clytia hemisphaerica]